ncbi:MAG: hypothetical protein KatS3mg083_429 [Candidatus Dojkabacteria bacterium]|nr:MAG: hypothetical protein KatS3mg083_429 [Candidatus Dojkabacteria bacterium]
MYVVGGKEIKNDVASPIITEEFQIFGKQHFITSTYLNVLGAGEHSGVSIGRVMEVRYSSEGPHVYD